ncbi:MAG: hypothetical protein IKO19_05435 [Candidatus Riflebacteria bacterium]|nr:hypothetical protein [Candidatus Riflebacteria bacterium]
MLKDRKALYETTAQGSVVDDLLLNPGDIKKSKEVLRNWVKTQDGVIKGDIKSNRAGTKFEWTEVLDDG